MRARITAALAALALGLTACSSTAPEPSSDGEVVRMWVEPDLAECVGVAPMMCLQVAYTEDGPTELFYDSIAGFDHVEGTSYVLDVEVAEVPDPPADASSLSYTLVDVVSQTPQ